MSTPRNRREKRGGWSRLGYLPENLYNHQRSLLELRFVNPVEGRRLINPFHGLHGYRIYSRLESRHRAKHNLGALAFFFLRIILCAWTQSSSPLYPSVSTPFLFASYRLQLAHRRQLFVAVLASIPSPRPLSIFPIYDVPATYQSKKNVLSFPDLQQRAREPPTRSSNTLRSIFRLFNVCR